MLILWLNWLPDVCFQYDEMWRLTFNDSLPLNIWHPPRHLLGPLHKFSLCIHVRWGSHISSRSFMTLVFKSVRDVFIVVLNYLYSCVGRNFSSPSFKFIVALSYSTASYTTQLLLTLCFGSICFFFVPLDSTRYITRCLDWYLRLRFRYIFDSRIFYYGRRDPSLMLSSNFCRVL